jgi:hypothetical protein
MLNIKFSVCITYYYKRNNINLLLNEINKYKLKNIEILIRNDNPSTKLIIKKKKNIRVFNAKKKALGEINSIKFLISKSSGTYVSIVADDDLISHKIFYELNKINIKKFDSFLFLSSTNINLFQNNYKIFLKKKIDLLNLFFKRKIYLSGTVATVFKKKFLLNYINKCSFLKYNFDLFFLFLMFFFGNLKIYNKIYGYNNVQSSIISSKKINISKYIHDTNKLFFFFNKKNYNYNILYFSFSKFFLENFYSILFRKKLCNFNLHDIIKFHIIFFNNAIILKKVIIIIMIFKNITKIYIKKLIAFLNN